MAQISCVVDPELYLIGGGVAGAFETFGPELRRRFAEHHPVGFDVIEIIEHETRDGDRFEVVDRIGAGEGSECGARRVERERDEALERADLALAVEEDADLPIDGA